MTEQKMSNYLFDSLLRTLAREYIVKTGNYIIKYPAEQL